jgi:DNA repair protein RecN (Recombination protein N)
MRDYIQGLPMDITRLEQVEERLFKLQGLKRRFGPEITDVLSYRDSLERELRDFQNLEGEMELLSRKFLEVSSRLSQAAARLSSKRHSCAVQMEAAIKAELTQLDLPGAEFKIRLNTPSRIRPEDIGPSGADNVEFLFSANPGQPPRPLAQVASGGELSRILLALKTVSRAKDLTETLVFDEIDAGLGGEIAENVGRKLKDMGKRHQVIAITHFPQIAALGDRHLVVEKIQEQGQTVTEVRSLSGEERLGEIVRMLGGETETARSYASELLGPVLRRS